MWGVLNSAGLKTYPRRLWYQLAVIIVALLPLIALGSLVVNGMRSIFGWAAVLGLTVAIMLDMDAALREVNPKSGGYPQVFARLKNWILSAAEIDRLRSGCLPDACREVADGHRVLNL